MNDIVFITCLTVLAILTTGDPDLLDAIARRVNQAPIECLKPEQAAEAAINAMGMRT